jgi:hypothetical protein
VAPLRCKPSGVARFSAGPGFSPPYHWHFNARTLKPTRALVFDANCLRAKCEGDHQLGYEMLKRFSNMRLRFPQGERRFFVRCL